MIVWDIVDEYKEKEDSRFFNGSITVLPKDKGSSGGSLSDLEKRFAPQKKMLNSLSNDTDTVIREIRKEIRDLNNSSTYKNTAEVKSNLRGNQITAMNLKLATIKELNAVEKTILSALKDSGGSIALVGGSNSVASDMNRQMGLEMKAGSSGDGGVKKPDLSQIYNPNNYMVTNKPTQPSNATNINISSSETGDGFNSNEIESRFIGAPDDETLDTVVGGVNYQKSEQALASRMTSTTIKTTEVLHYDEEKGLFWYDVHDSDGNSIPSRINHIVNYKDAKVNKQNMTATDDMGNIYKLVVDSSSNMPDEYVRQYMEFTDKFEEKNED